MIKARLSHPALLAIVSASVELYKREAIGYLYGHRRGNLFYITHALPDQSAKTGYDHAETTRRGVGRINAVVDNTLPGRADYIGGWHSHPAWGSKRYTPTPSSRDLAYMKADTVDIICAVNPRRRNIPWHVNARGILTGTTGDYRIDIGAHYVARPAASSKYQRVHLNCPAITGEEKE